MIKAVILTILLLIIAFGLFIWRARKQWSAYTTARFETITHGTFSDYFEIDGYRIPRKGAVEWHLKDGVYPYWKAELKTVEFN